MRRVILFLLFVILSSCASGGPKVTVCIVDAPNSGFQCVDHDGNENFVALRDGSRLACSSPDESEQFLKACKNGIVKKITACRYQIEQAIFRCKKPDQSEYDLLIRQADNYVCMTDRDIRRIIERCGQ